MTYLLTFTAGMFAMMVVVDVATRDWRSAIGNAVAVADRLDVLT